jgi:hypothetical protein
VFWAVGVRIVAKKEPPIVLEHVGWHVLRGHIGLSLTVCEAGDV